MLLLLATALAAPLQPSAAEAAELGTVFGWLERCPCAEQTDACGCPPASWVLADERFHPEAGFYRLDDPGVSPLEHGYYTTAVLPPHQAFKGRRHSTPGWVPTSLLAIAVQADLRLWLIGGGVSGAMALLVVLCRLALGAIQHVGARAVAPHLTESAEGEAFSLRPYGRSEALLSLCSAAMWTGWLLFGWVFLLFTELAGSVFLAFLALELVTSAGRWRHRTGGQLTLAILIALPFTASISMLAAQSALGYGAFHVVGIYGWVFGLLVTPWIVCRRLARAWATWTTRFDFVLEPRRLRWRLAVGWRRGDWVTVPYDGMRAQLVRTLRGRFLDLGGGDALQITGAGPAAAAWVEEELRRRVVEAEHTTDLDSEALDAVRTIGGQDRQRPPQPHVGLQPAFATAIGITPMTLFVVAFGTVLLLDGMGLGVLVSGLLAVAGASIVGSVLYDPLPIVERPAWMRPGRPG